MRPDKRLGQHFLRDPEILETIASVADVGRSAGVLEIGPGEGALTAFLVGQGVPVHALEIDPRGARAVRQRLGNAVHLVQGDALEVDLGALLPKPTETRRPVVVANLPYNVGSAIYRRLLELGPNVARHVLMLQREVAKRIIAKPGERAWGILGVATSMVADAWSILEVPPDAFFPPPKVHSSVILVEPLATPRVPLELQRPLMGVARRLFQGRRKILSNTIGNEAALKAAGLDPRGRAESVELDALIRLTQALIEFGEETELGAPEE